MIYFVRHGETDFNLFSVSQGQLDTSLNKTGLKQAEQLAEKLRDFKFDVVFSSSLTRCTQTAEIILKYHSNDLITDPRLMEVSKGNLQGTRNSQEVYNQFFADPHKFGGETEEDVFLRVSSFLKDIEKYKGKNILIVSHGGVFKYISFCLQGKDIKKDKLTIMDMENCQVEEFQF